jgi:GT2 family glycosyltransferase
MVIGVCTYNRGAAISRTLEALAALDPVIHAGSPRLARIVLVDNRSTDDTAAVVDAFIAERAAAGRFPFLRIRESTPGKCAAMRRLFAETSEPIVAIIDDDTIPEPGWATAMLSLLDAQPRAGIASGPVHNIWESGPTALAQVYRRSLGDQLMGESRKRLDRPGEFLMGASLACRRVAVEQSGWLDHVVLESRTGKDLQCGAEDAELCIRIRQAGWEVWYEPAARMGHLIPASRQTPEYLARLREGICRGEPAIAWLAERRGRTPADIAWAESSFRRARRRYLKTLLGTWNPARRRIRVAERRGKLRGWGQLLAQLRAPEPAPPPGVSLGVARARHPSRP